MKQIKGIRCSILSDGKIARVDIDGDNHRGVYESTDPSASDSPPPVLSGNKNLQRLDRYCEEAPTLGAFAINEIRSYCILRVGVDLLSWKASGQQRIAHKAIWKLNHLDGVRWEQYKSHEDPQIRLEASI